MNCIFIKQDDNYICEVCGWSTKIPNVNRNCKKHIVSQPNYPPNIFKKMSNFSSAVIKDLSTGMERSTEEEINRKLEICKGCEFYKKLEENRGVCTHSQCGCNISNEQIYMNKLYLKSQSCPVGKW